jgi:antitoxin VapB
MIYIRGREIEEDCKGEGLHEYRFTTDEVYIRRDSQSGDLILSEAPGGWEEIFAALDEAGFPDDFLADRGQGVPQQRDEL